MNPNRSLSRVLRVALALVAAAVVVTLVVVVGGSGDDGAQDDRAASDERERGGTLNLISADDVDYLDPGQAYNTLSWMLLRSVHRSLYSVPADELEPVPDLAASAPKVSSDGRTVTVKIRRGVRFSPPVDREIVAADVKYAIERGFAVSVANSYASAYFGVIAGAPARPPRTPKPISGITTPDEHTLVFELTEPAGAFVDALVLPLTAPVPKEYASRYDRKSSSDYAFHQVASGPYMVASDAAGNVNGVGYAPGKLIRLVRNPNWDAKTDFRPAHLDRINLKEGFTDSTLAIRQILTGAADFNTDIDPPPSLVKQITSTESLKDNLYTWPLGTTYVALNTQKPPFGDVHVRRAVAFVLDRNAMRLAFGGSLTGRIATHFIGPDFEGKGFEAAGGYDFNPFPSPDFKGSVERARAELEKAGHRGGTFSGPAVTAVVTNSSAHVNMGKVLVASLARIGIEVKLKPVSNDAMLTRFCGSRANAPEICPSVGWLPDFKDPATLLEVTFSGKHIPESGNVNWPQLNDPAINAAMERAKRIRDADERYAAWGRIDRMIAESAAAIPLLWLNNLNVISDRVVPAKMLDLQGQPELAFTSLK